MCLHANEQAYDNRQNDFLAHGFIVARIDGGGVIVVELAKVAALAQW